MKTMIESHAQGVQRFEKAAQDYGQRKITFDDLVSVVKSVGVIPAQGPADDGYYAIDIIDSLNAMRFEGFITEDERKALLVARNA